MKINKIFLGVAALATLILGACDDTPQGSSSSFPTETQTFTASPSDTVAVTFTANSAWQLSSDAMWCKVDGLFLDTSGKAGEQRVAFVITADGQSVDTSKAHITLRMGDESGIIAIITRRGITDAIVLGNDSLNYTHGETLTIGTSGSQSVVLRKTTFDSNNLHISTNADWFEVLREDSVITLSVKPELLKYSQCNTTDSICFSNLDVPMMRLNVQYTGMDAYGVNIEPATQWDIQVSIDGATYKDAMYEMTGEIHEAPLTATISVLNDAYTLFYAVYDNELGCTLVETDSSLWFAVQNDQAGNISIIFDPNEGAQRIAYVFVLPQAIKDSLTSANAVADFLFEEIEGKKEIKEECEQYLIAELIQENALADAFSIEHGRENYEVDFNKETDSQWLEQAEGHGVPSNQVFHTKLEYAVMYKINPKFSSDTWKPDVVDGAHIELRKNDNSVIIDKENVGTEERPKIFVNYQAEPMMTDDDLYYIMQFKFSYKEEDITDYIIYFVDAQGNYLKALVVENILE